MTSPSRTPLGVGIVGCGAITQACHLPAIASLPDLFDVVHCTDTDAGVAHAVADRHPRATASTRLEDLLADPAVDVVAVCVPDRFHAPVVEQVCAAKVRAVLCEKPLAGSLDDADRIVAASEAFGVPVVVATMHRYDPAVQRLVAHWGDLAERATLVRSTMCVPPNERLIDLATELAVPAPKPTVQPAAPPPSRDAIRRILPGAWASTTFVHHMPLLRLAFDGPPDRVEARALGVSGAQVMLRWGQRAAQLFGVAHSFGAIDWSFDVWAGDGHARVEFPPSFLAAHGAVGRMWTADGSSLAEWVAAGSHDTGYREEWRHIAQVARGECEPLTSARSARDDVRLVQLIDEAGRRALDEAAEETS